MARDGRLSPAWSRWRRELARALTSTQSIWLAARPLRTTPQPASSCSGSAAIEAAISPWSSTGRTCRRFWPEIRRRSRRRSLRTPEAGGVSPYAAFGDVISVPGSAAASAFYFTPEVTRRSKFANAVWAINDFFESFDFFASPASSRLASPLAAGAAQAMRSATTRLNRSLQSEPPSSGPPSSSGDGVWNNWGCLWDRSVSDPWKQPTSGPC